MTTRSFPRAAAAIGALSLAWAFACSGPADDPDAAGLDGATRDAGTASDGGEASDASRSTDAAPGDAGAEGGALCQEGCMDDADCTIGSADMGHRCLDGRCRMPPDPACLNDLQCVADHSLWGATPCSDDAACAELSPAARCVDLDGPGPGTEGGCAEDATDGCRFRLPLTALGIDGSDVRVCGTPYVCDGVSGECERAPCADDDDCPGATFDMCDASSGRCVDCLSDADCVDSVRGTRCSPQGICGCADDSECGGAFTGCRPDGNCGCADDSECAGSPLGDVCDVDSRVCGCADVSSCSDDPVFDGTSYVCQRF